MSIHVLTVDVECPVRILAGRYAGLCRPPAVSTCASTERVLGILEAHGVRATFFVVTSVAARYPALVRTIATAGHEVALHGVDHASLSELAPAAFGGAVRRARQLLEDIVGRAVIGHRAPYLSLRTDTRWSLPALLEAGFVYDSSAFPMLSRAGRLRVPSTPFCFGNGLIEIPATCIEFAGMGVAAAGGGYLRHLPSWWIAAALAQASRQGRTGCVYVHPYEFDPAWTADLPPAMPLRGRLAARSAAHNAGRAMDERFRGLLRRWRFQTAAEAAAHLRPQSAATPLAAVRVEGGALAIGR